MSKLSLVAALALGGLMAFSTLATAQDAPKDASKGGKKGFGVDQQLERMTTALTLTDDQKPKVKTVLEDSMKKMKELRSDSSLDQAGRREKMKTIREDQNTKMKAILTDDQYKKYETMNQHHGKKKKSE